ncbi:ATP-dependent DNA helicase [Sanguibacter sp. A247]|uniref:ATP-dependent DNA helicase n=1 Tax=unclassified Sanguibacter TaxID=2645534 RepID=UPI003FD88395
MQQSHTILDAEAYLLARTQTATAAHLTDVDAARLVAAASSAQLTEKGFALAEDQERVARAVLADPAGLSAIVGPAGTGKTTTMRAVRSAWEAIHGPGSVVGVTTSAQAAAVLAAETGVETTTIAKRLHETAGPGAEQRATFIAEMHQVLADETRPHLHAGARRGLAKALARAESWQLTRGQLLIVDEASMSGTHALAELARQAENAGAKVLLVGDPAQLDAVDAGGVLGWLERRGATVALDSVWRFDGADNKDWEPTSSLALRAGNIDVIDTYLAHDRIKAGSDENILEAAYAAARDDQAAGRSTILIAATNAAVSDLNQCFTLDRRATGEVDITQLATLRAGADGGVGDQVLYRKVDRTLLDSRGDFIRNGTPLRITRITRTKVHAQRTDTEDGTSFVIPRANLAEHGELGYAITAHRAQGTTVDVGHVVVPSDTSMTRETYYVAMTRGRKANTTWVGQQDPEPDRERLLAAADLDTWRSTLERIIATSGAELTAHETSERWTSEHHSLSRLHAERDLLLSLAADERVERGRAALIERIAAAMPATDAAAVTSSPRLGALRVVVDRLTDAGVDVEALLSQFGADGLEHMRDAAAVLAARLRKYAHVAGIDLTTDVALEDLVRPVRAQDQGLDEVLTINAEHIAERTRVLVEAAATTPWARYVDPNLPGREQLLAGIAVYRDRYDVEHPSPLGPRPVSEGLVDWRRGATSRTRCP